MFNAIIGCVGTVLRGFCPVNRNSNRSLPITVSVSGKRNFQGRDKESVAQPPCFAASLGTPPLSTLASSAARPRDHLTKQLQVVPSNFINCICLIGAKSSALVETVMPGSSIGNFKS